jgi:hypothetical protein
METLDSWQILDTYLAVQCSFLHNISDAISVDEIHLNENMLSNAKQMYWLFMLTCKCVQEMGEESCYSQILSELQR